MSRPEKTLLITGHEGYIGSGLFESLRRRHRVIGWGRREDVFKLTASRLSHENIQAVIHLAAEIDRVNRPYDIHSSSERINVAGARHLVNILKATSIFFFQISLPAVSVLINRISALVLELSI